MKNKPPVPICTAFLVCRSFAKDNRTDDDILVGLPRAFWSRSYPGACKLGFFMRCTSAHGKYPVEVQLQDTSGNAVWKDGPGRLWEMLDPLEIYDFMMNLNVVFPAPGVYQLVLVLNGDEVSRQTFHAKMADAPAPHAN